VVLLQELERWNALVAAMASGLHDLSRALSGEVGFSGPLEELAAALANGKLPPAWARLAPQTQKPLGAWMAWFGRRHAQYAAWAEKGEPAAMWLAGLHAPETYLAALVQAACRDRGWPLDRSRLDTRVTRYTDAAQLEERPRRARAREPPARRAPRGAAAGLPLAQRRRGALSPAGVPHAGRPAAAPRPDRAAPNPLRARRSLRPQCAPLPPCPQRLGCYVSGLYLEGAAWDHDAGQLVRQGPKQLVQELPLLQVVPTEVRGRRTPRARGHGGRPPRRPPGSTPRALRRRTDAARRRAAGRSAPAPRGPPPQNPPAHPAPPHPAPPRPPAPPVPPARRPAGRRRPARSACPCT
jgi:hypothetical protein